MFRVVVRCVSGVVAASALVIAVPSAVMPQAPDVKGKIDPKGKVDPKGKIVPKLEAIAETKLLMEGLAHANFRGLDRLLQKKPDDPQAWVFARGQALLIAETANLLMLRPPKKEGQPAWFERATELRSTATKLAQTLGKRDYDGARAGLVSLANSCNRCHQTFRVSVEITPFTEEK